MKKYSNLDSRLQNDQVKYYYQILHKKSFEIYLKYFLDKLLAIVLLFCLMMPMVIIAIFIYFEDRGPVFYLQERIADNYRIFKIIKFRSMRVSNDTTSLVTSANDDRITKVGKFIRKFRLDELPQLFNIIKGDMTFIGTRPEVMKYVVHYSPMMRATLLMKPGVSSRCSIEFKDEDKILSYYLANTDLSVDEIYLRYILPKKMEINLRSLANFSLFDDFKLIFLTVIRVFIKR